MKFLLAFALISCASSALPPPANKPVEPVAPAARPEKPKGGVVQTGPESIDIANREMEALCGPDNYTITQQGEEKLDPDDQSVEPETVYRFHYVCNK